MVVIRLARHGAKKLPFYHIIAAEKTAPRDGKFIERLGFHNPVHRGKAERVRLNLERYDYWLGTGAQPTDRVLSLVKEYRKIYAAELAVLEEQNRLKAAEAAEAAEAEAKRTALESSEAELAVELVAESEEGQVALDDEVDVPEAVSEERPEQELADLDTGDHPPAAEPAEQEDLADEADTDSSAAEASGEAAAVAEEEEETAEPAEADTSADASDLDSPAEADSGEQAEISETDAAPDVLDSREETETEPDSPTDEKHSGDA